MATIQYGFSQKLLKKDLLQLKTWMQGSHSNKEQQLKDSTVPVIIARMQPVWPKRKDGYWLYAEQATAAMPAKTDRQRMLHLYLQDDSTIVCQVFEFKNPSMVDGWWKYPKRFDTVKFFALSSRPGCELYFRKNKKGQFSGSTEGKDCINNISGASYATSEMLIDKMNLVFWDRGWDIKQQQVWGATSGPYQLKRAGK